jgi:hypothetical protein
MPKPGVEDLHEEPAHAVEVTDLLDEDVPF